MLLCITIVMGRLFLRGVNKTAKRFIYTQDISEKISEQGGEN